LVVTRGWQIGGLAALLALGAGGAQAENLDAGKSAQALFTSTCASCHSSPKGLARNRQYGLASFLQEHYTSSPQSAALLAAYLMANPGSPQGKQAAPTGRAAAPSEGKRGEAKTEPAGVPHTATARPDSMIEPVEPHRSGSDSAKGRGKRQGTKQETPAAPPASSTEPTTAQPAAPAPAPAAAPVAAAPPPPDQPAFSAPSP
jgi:hypothetical protein